MTKFISGEFESTGQKWKDDPANGTADELLNELSEELGTDGPAETFGHPDESVVGRLVEDDQGAGPDLTSEAIAYDTHDAEGLSAEEAAIHFVDESQIDTEQSDLSAASRRELRNF